MANLTITAANVLAGSGARIERGYAAAQNLTGGQSVYLDTSTDPPRWRQADADAAGGTASMVGGVALHSTSALQPVAVITEGDYNPGATVAVGTIYVVGATAGSIAPAADLTSGWYTAIIGIATTTSNINIMRHAGGVAIP